MRFYLEIQLKLSVGVYPARRRPVQTTVRVGDENR